MCANPLCIHAVCAYLWSCTVKQLMDSRLCPYNTNPIFWLGHSQRTERGLACIGISFVESIFWSPVIQFPRHKQKRMRMDYPAPVVHSHPHSGCAQNE